MQQHWTGKHTQEIPTVDSNPGTERPPLWDCWIAHTASSFVYPGKRSHPGRTFSERQLAAMINGNPKQHNKQLGEQPKTPPPWLQLIQQNAKPLGLESATGCAVIIFQLCLRWTSLGSGHVWPGLRAARAPSDTKGQAWRMYQRHLVGH